VTETADLHAPARPAAIVVGRAAALLVGWVALALPVAVWLGNRRSGDLGIEAVLVAAAISTAAALVALGVVAAFRSPLNSVSGVLLSTLFRLGIPLAACVFLKSDFPALVAAGAVGWIVAFYLWVLPVEAWLSLRILRSGLPSGARPSVGGPSATWKGVLRG
jgi:hypothetical protein